MRKVHIVGSWVIGDFNADVAIDQRYNVSKNQLLFCTWIMNRVGFEHIRGFRDPYYDGVYLWKEIRAKGGANTEQQKICDTFDEFPIVMSEIQFEVDIYFVYLETTEDSSLVLVSVIKNMLGSVMGLGDIITIK